MKAAEIVDAVIAALREADPPDFLRLNLANGDMVGHSGDLEAATLAVECVDLALGSDEAARVIEALMTEPPVTSRR